MQKGRESLNVDNGNNTYEKLKICQHKSIKKFNMLHPEVQQLEQILGCPHKNDFEGIV